MSISFAALIAAEVSFMRMFGLGLTLAILVDATLVRMVLMPAFMHVMGEWNWWAPRWLTRLHDRFGLDDGRCSSRGAAERSDRVARSVHRYVNQGRVSDQQEECVMSVIAAVRENSHRTATPRPR